VRKRDALGKGGTQAKGREEGAGKHSEQQSANARIPEEVILREKRR